MAPEFGLTAKFGSQQPDTHPADTHMAEPRVVKLLYKRQAWRLQGVGSQSYLDSTLFFRITRGASDRRIHSNGETVRGNGGR